MSPFLGEAVQNGPVKKGDRQLFPPPAHSLPCADGKSSKSPFSTPQCRSACQGRKRAPNMLPICAQRTWNVGGKYANISRVGATNLFPFVGHSRVPSFNGEHDMPKFLKNLAKVKTGMKNVKDKAVLAAFKECEKHRNALEN